MHTVRRARFAFAFMVFSAAHAGAEGADMASMESGTLRVSLDPSGAYAVADGASAWELKGTLPAPAQGIRPLRAKDSLGSYQELAFRYRDPAGPMRGSLRLYDGKNLVLFTQAAQRAMAQAPAPFPDFTDPPKGLLRYSYRAETFAPPSFGLEAGATPWMLFDPDGHALILSPASDFMNAGMWGDGATRLASGYAPAFTKVPSGFSHRSLLALGRGINATWDLWGRALTDLQGKVRPSNGADRVLKYFGYWTDAESAYWYNYDPELGYEGTLKELAASYKREGIPLGYMQLDSWWYHKTLADPSGKIGGPRNPKLPEGDWNRYGGMTDYSAHPFVFPQGMAEFSQSTGLALVNHDRWVDPSSPYHAKYRISGIAAVDPRFWDEIAGYLKSCGSMAYEQDWLNEIYLKSPQLAAEAGLGDAAMDAMAKAFASRGMSLQYCMGLPLHFLQGSRYGNLTSIRVSGDGFQPGRYHDFLYASRLASALGIWPWCDVFMSRETDNFVLAVLSAGPVGTGDFLGMEDKANILKAVRSDGVIVKPDAALVPLDSCYVHEAQGLDRPLLASTFTDHAGLRTVYGVAIRTSDQQGDSLALDPAELGCSGSVYYFDYFSGEGTPLKPGQALPISFHKGRFSYFEVAPLGAQGMALLGDEGKFVGTGKRRVAELSQGADGLRVKLLFAQGEGRVTLRGYAASEPRAQSDTGARLPLLYDPASGRFSVSVAADLSQTPQTLDQDVLRTAGLVLTAQSSNPARP
jgi:hypothetical protein